MKTTTFKVGDRVRMTALAISNWMRRAGGRVPPAHYYNVGVVVELTGYACAHVQFEGCEIKSLVELKQLELA